MGQAVDDRIRATTQTSGSVFRSRSTTRLAAEDRFQQRSRALDLVRDSVVALDPQGRITYVNHAAEDLYGLTRLELLGQVARTTLFAESEFTFDSAWGEVIARGAWSGTISQRTKQGTECLMESRWSVLRDRQSSRIISVLIVNTETSRAKLTAAHLAHEIRNPLAGIKGVAEAFLQRYRLTRQERQWMEAVRQGVMNIDSRLRELLDVAKPRVFETRLCVLSDLISKVILLATHQVQSIEGRRISIEFIDDTLEPLILPLDSARLEDAVLNLVLNAIEAIDGDGRVTVCLRRHRFANGEVAAVIEVTDTGCGVPREIRRRIFEPLFTTKSGGTGLGLAAVRRVAAAYHGRVTFKTRIDRGSTFVLALPIRPQANLTENQE